jgi:hypothetical protein
MSTNQVFIVTRRRNEMDFNLDSELARKLGDGMRFGDAVELPFPVIYLWALSGQASYKAQGNALYYGGFACKADAMAEINEQQTLDIPEGWKQVTIGSRDGQEFEAFVTRSVLVAPFSKRISWLLDGQRSPEYVDGGRRHIQVLAYLAEKKGTNGDSQYIPWGPVVLTAKGYQAKHLTDALQRWEKASSYIRRKVAPGIPAWCFYLALGTFGKERLAVNVGKPGAQSPITPITSYIPDNLDEKQLAKLFVGNDVASIMADLQDNAQEWLSAWQQPVQENGQAIQSYDEGPDNFSNFPDEIPF